MHDIRQSISSQQRMDMVLKGLNPLLESDVKSYLQKGGNIRKNQEALMERFSTLVGHDILEKGSLGSANEKETEYGTAYKESGLPIGINAGYEQDFIPTTPQDYRKKALQQLNEYENAGLKEIDGDELLSLRRPTKTYPETSNKKQNYKKIGYELSIQYLNAFIVNLKDPNTKNRLELFKKLKSVLETENKLKNSPTACNEFKKGCIEAEDKMYNQLKS